MACQPSCQTAPPHPPADAERLTRSQPLLGTLVTITVHGGDRVALNAAVNAAFDEVRAVDRLLSIHRPDSELRQLNQSASTQSTVISPALFDVLQKAFALAAQSEGAFDPTVRPLVDLWGFIKKENYRIPTEAELRAALLRVGHHHVEFNATARSIRFAKAGMSIDPGGFGKGYAVDRAVERLRALGVTSAMVKAGGDLRVLGLPPGAEQWIVQIEDPDKRGQRVPIALRGGALSTSGNYENFFEIAGVRYGHLLDPRTGWPVRTVRTVLSCTVTAPTCLEADALATACSVLGTAKSMERLGARYGLRLITDENGQQRVHQSPLFPK